MTEKEYERLKNIDYGKFADDITAQLRNNVKKIGNGNGSLGTIDILFGAYILLWMQKPAVVINEFDDFFHLLMIEQDNILNGAYKIPFNYLGATYDPTVGELANLNWETLLKLKGKYSADVLTAYLLFARFDLGFTEISTPESLSILAVNELAIKQNEKVADMYDGVGSFFREAFIIQNKAKYYIFHGNEDFDEGTWLRADVLGMKLYNNPYDDFFIDMKDSIYDKLFCDLNKFEIKYLNIEHDPFFIKHKGLGDDISAEWVSTIGVIKHLAKRGKGCTIIPNAALTNVKDKKVRKWLVDNKYLEKIIVLPNKLYEEDPTVSVSMLVLSHENKTVQIIDAREEYTVKRNKWKIQNYMSSNQIQSILKDKSKIKNIPLNTIAKQEYTFNPAIYFIEVETGDKSIPLRELITNIRRGKEITAEELEDYRAAEYGDLYYLTASDIKDGILNENLTQLYGNIWKWEELVANKGDLLITKNGKPFKCIVLDKDYVLVNRNFYIIQVNEKLADPIYIKLFLESEKGELALDRECSTGKIPMLTTTGIMNIRIPKKSLTEQKELAKRYLKINDAIQKKQNEIRELLYARINLMEDNHDKK